MKTRITELLKIKHPIIQASMAWIADAELAGAVSAAGGLGTLGPNAGAKTVTTDVDQVGKRLRDQIRRVRQITDNPFAVNFVVGVPGLDRKYSEESIAVGIEEKVPVAIVSQGNPAVHTERLKAAGMTVIHVCSSVHHAVKAEAAGADAVVVSGTEGGGHSGFDQISTICLAPQAAEAVKIPVIAGGGIGDGRGLAAALALGAEGVYIGTRFIATVECPAHENVKQILLGCTDTSTIAIKHGSPAQAKAKGTGNRGFVEERRGSLRMVINDFIISAMREKGGDLSFDDLFKLLATSTGDEDEGSNRTVSCFIQGKVKENPVSAGQASGMIRDLPTCAALTARIVQEAEVAIARLGAMK